MIENKILTYSYLHSPNHLQMKQRDLPLGYWLKKADELLTKGINQAQATNGLTRTGWQTLNLINQEEDISQAELFRLMKPFAGSAEVDSIIKDFDNREMLESIFPLSLNAKGKKVHAECLELQKKFRAQTMKGIKEEDYRTTISTLQKLVSNLEE